jgi:hypothetical protein
MSETKKETKNLNPLSYVPSERNKFLKERLKVYTSLNKEKAEDANLAFRYIPKEENLAKVSLDNKAYAIANQLNNKDIIEPNENEKLIERLAFEAVNNFIKQITPKSMTPKTLTPEEVLITYKSTKGYLNETPFDTNNTRLIEIIKSKGVDMDLLISKGIISNKGIIADELSPKEIDILSLLNNEAGGAIVSQNLVQLHSESDKAYFRRKIGQLRVDAGGPLPENIENAFLDYSKLHTLTHELFHLTDKNAIGDYTINGFKMKGLQHKTGLSTTKTGLGLGINEVTKNMMANRAAKEAILKKYPNEITPEMVKVFNQLLHKTDGYADYQDSLFKVLNKIATSENISLSAVKTELCQESIYGAPVFNKRLHRTYGSSARSVINQLGKDNQANQQYVEFFLNDAVKMPEFSLQVIPQLYQENPKEGRAVINKLVQTEFLDYLKSGKTTTVLADMFIEKVEKALSEVALLLPPSQYTSKELTKFKNHIAKIKTAKLESKRSTNQS